MYSYLSNYNTFSGTAVVLLVSLQHIVTGSQFRFDAVWGQLAKVPLKSGQIPKVKATMAALSARFPERLFAIMRSPGHSGQRLYYQGRLLHDADLVKITSDPGTAQEMDAVSQQLRAGLEKDESYASAAKKAFNHWMTGKRHFLPEELAKRVVRIWF